MGWAEARRWSGFAYRELAFQAIYAFRQGAIAPNVPAAELVPRAERRVLQGKLVVATTLVLLAAGAALLAHVGPTVLPGPAVAPGAYTVGIVTAVLSLEVTFLWWTGLQILPTFVASRALEALVPLPIDPATFRKIAALLYLKLFDAPVAAVLVATPAFFGLALGWPAGAALVPATVCAVAFALGLSLVTGRFFYRRVLGSRGGGGSTLLRWAYLVLWVAPAFALVGFVTVAPSFFAALEPLASGFPSTPGVLLLAAFPIPFSAFAAFLAPTGGHLALGPGTATIVVAAMAGYAGLAGGVLSWVYGSVGRLAGPVPAVVRPGPAPQYRLRPQRAPWAVMTKDLRLASRTPGFAFLVLLPVLDALALGLLTYARAAAQAATSLALGAVSAAALLATFFGPAFFAIEVIAYSYGRTLPLPDRAVVVGKATLVAAIYLVSGGLVLGLAGLRIPAPLVFAGFVAAELPAVLAATLLELGLLFRWARRRATPVPNLYSGAWNAFVVTLPGLAIAAFPLLLDQVRGLGTMALAAVAELVVIAPVVLGRDGR